MVMHWKTVSTAKRMLSKLVMPKLGPGQYSRHLVPFSQVRAGGNSPQGKSATCSPERTHTRTTQQALTGRTTLLQPESHTHIYQYYFRCRLAPIMNHMLINLSLQTGFPLCFPSGALLESFSNKEVKIFLNLPNTSFL